MHSLFPFRGRQESRRRRRCVRRECVLQPPRKVARQQRSTETDDVAFSLLATNATLPDDGKVRRPRRIGARLDMHKGRDTLTVHCAYGNAAGCAAHIRLQCPDFRGEYYQEETSHRNTSSALQKREVADGCFLSVPAREHRSPPGSPPPPPPPGGCPSAR